MTDDAGYMFGSHPHQAELERLQMQERSIDWVSIGILSSLGLAAGCRCLEAGVGAGSMLRWMADAVTDSGRVVGVDLDDRFFDLNLSSAIDMRKENVLTVDLPDASFDFVHCRLLLMHLSETDRQALLGRFLAALRPGGWLVAIDAAYGYRPVPSQRRAQELWYKLNDAIVDFTKERSDFTLGSRLPSLAAEAGFTQIGGMGFFGLPFGDNDYWQTIRNSAEVSKRMGIVGGSSVLSATELDELIELSSGHDVESGVSYAMTWARKPN